MAIMGVASLFSMATFGQVKATTLQSVFIYSALKYMEWPNDDLPEITIVVLGESPIYDELVKVAQTKKVGSRSITVNKASSIDEVTKGHILFISSNKVGSLSTHLESINKNAILIITEKEGALSQGSDLNFVQRGERIAFQLSEKSLASKKIKVSSAFSNLAVRQ